VSERTYKIRNKNTGLFLSSIEIIYGYYKSGKPRYWPSRENPDEKSMLLKFTKQGCGYDTTLLNNTIFAIIKCKSTSELGDMEIVAYEPIEVKTTLRMPTVIRRMEAKVLINKLSGGSQ
jgi:hypothetical protein